jgi:hypothetical protein
LDFGFWILDFSECSKILNPKSKIVLAFSASCGLRAATAATNDKLVGTLVVAGAITLGGFTPFGLRLASPGSAALATTVGMVAGVHCGSAHFGPPAQPAGTARLADTYIGVVHVPYLAEEVL